MAKSNKNMHSFEQEWANAFENAEMTPSGQVWMNIEGTLANSDARKYKRGLFYYRWVAAASLVIAATLGITLILRGPEDNVVTTNQALESPQLEENQVHNNQFPKSNMAESDNVLEREDEEINHSGNVPLESGSESLVSRLSVTPDSVDDQANPSNFILKDAIDKIATLGAREENEIITEAFTPTNNERQSSEPQIASLILASRQLSSDTQKPDTDVHMYNLPIPASTEKLRFNAQQLWAGVGLSTGSFDPNIGPGNGVNESLRADQFVSLEEDAFSNAVDQSMEDNDPGISYSIAINGGWKFAPKWILQSGLQYQISRSSTQANTIIQNTATDESFPLTDLSRDVALAEAGDLQATSADLNLRNNYQFLSLPVKVGYLILDRNFLLGVNTGISTDLFLKNKVSETNDLIGNFEQTPGSGSPFRRTFFSGIVGIELGYNFLKKYSITLEPTYRRSINSLTKQSVNVRSRPSSLGVVAGFRYTFK